VAAPLHPAPGAADLALEGRPKAYDDAISRHRLRQAFGRLVRRADDRGVFVLLDGRCPSRLLAGLPEGSCRSASGCGTRWRRRRSS
jgi:ATP-dependent DNA helicase DinG